MGGKRLAITHNGCSAHVMCELLQVESCQWRLLVFLPSYEHFAHCAQSGTHTRYTFYYASNLLACM